jgi:hypothetical protein
VRRSCSFQRAPALAGAVVVSSGYDRSTCPSFRVRSTTSSSGARGITARAGASAASLCPSANAHRIPSS